NLFNRLNWQNLQQYISCAGGAGTSFSTTLAKCIAGCLPSLYFGPKAYGACLAACTGIDLIINLWLWGQCWDTYNENQRLNINAYCLCLNKRSKCPSSSQRTEDGYHAVNCSGTPIPQAPGTPVWP